MVDLSPVELHFIFFHYFIYNKTSEKSSILTNIKEPQGQRKIIIILDFALFSCPCTSITRTTGFLSLRKDSF